MKLFSLVCFILQFSNGMSDDEYVKCDYKYWSELSVEWNADNMHHFCLPGPANCKVWPSSLPKKFDGETIIPLGEDENKFEEIAASIVIQLETGKISEGAGFEELEGKKNLLKCSERFHGDDALYLKDLHLICDQRVVLIEKLQNPTLPIRIEAYNKSNKETCKIFDGIKDEIYSSISDEAQKDKAKKSCERACTFHFELAKNSLSAGAIAGIVIGCVAGVILIGGIIFFVTKSK